MRENAVALRPKRRSIWPTTDSRLLELARLDELTPNQSQPALRELCLRYWQPIRIVIRSQSIRRRMREHRGPDHDLDLTNAFIAGLLDSGVASYDRRAGTSFRAWLNQAIQNFLRNTLKHERREMRSALMTSELDAMAPVAYAAIEPRHSVSPERLLAGSMAICAVNEAWAVTRRWYAERGDADRFDALEQFIPQGELADLDYAPVAPKLGLDARGVAKAVHDLRERYRDALRRQIRATVPSEDDVDDELRALIRWSKVTEHA